MKKNDSGENKRTHLLIIQEIITRMGYNSFSLKEWSIGIMIAIYSFVGNGEKTSNKAIIITIIPLIIFWFLDTYYLTLERKFRALYDKVRNQDECDIDFSMNTNDIKLEMKDLKKYEYINVLFSNSVFFFYIVCISTTLIIYFIKI